MSIPQASSPYFMGRDAWSVGGQTISPNQINHSCSAVPRLRCTRRPKKPRMKNLSTVSTTAKKSFKRSIHALHKPDNFSRSLQSRTYMERRINSKRIRRRPFFSRRSKFSDLLVIPNEEGLERSEVPASWSTMLALLSLVRIQPDEFFRRAQGIKRCPNGLKFLEITARNGR